MSYDFFCYLLFRPWFKEAFLHGNLFGESGCIGLGDLKTIAAQSETPFFDLSESKPDKMDLNLGPAPRNVYPVVFCCISEKNHGNKIVSFLTHLHSKFETIFK